MKNKLIVDKMLKYDGINLALVWQIIAEDMPTLKHDLIAIVR